MRERDLDVLAFEVNDRIQRLTAEVLLQQILQPVLGLEGLAVERQREAAVQERVVPQHVLDELRAKLEILPEERLVRRELDQRAVSLVGLRDLVILLQLSLLEFDDLRLTVAKRLRAIREREARSPPSARRRSGPTAF